MPANHSISNRIERNARAIRTVRGEVSNLGRHAKLTLGTFDSEAPRPFLAARPLQKRFACRKHSQHLTAISRGYSYIARKRQNWALFLFSRRLGRFHRNRWSLRVRELIVKFAVAHRSDQNVDDHGDLFERWNGDCVLARLKLNRFRS